MSRARLSLVPSFAAYAAPGRPGLRGRMCSCCAPLRSRETLQHPRADRRVVAVVQRRRRSIAAFDAQHECALLFDGEAKRAGNVLYASERRIPARVMPVAVGVLLACARCLGAPDRHLLLVGGLFWVVDVERFAHHLPLISTHGPMCRTSSASVASVSSRWISRTSSSPPCWS